MFGFGVGLILGLVFAVLGAGGGIIAVPVLLVLLHLSLAEASGAGLAIVFTAAVTSAVGYARARRIDWRTVLVLSPTLMGGAALGARLSPLVPERWSAGLFAAVLLIAIASLFRPKREAPGRASNLTLVVTGLVLGALTGLLGVGGGFLLVPVLVALGGLPLPQAVGTSTALIAASSFAGGLSALVLKPSLLPLVAPLALGAMAGAIAGVPLGGHLPERGLRLGFAGLAGVVAVGMVFKALGA
jgi:uncharacterized protein